MLKKLRECGAFFLDNLSRPRNQSLFPSLKKALVNRYFNYFEIISLPSYQHQVYD
jgi:hypothetical protein